MIGESYLWMADIRWLRMEKGKGWQVETGSDRNQRYAAIP